MIPSVLFALGFIGTLAGPPARPNGSHAGAIRGAPRVSAALTCGPRPCVFPTSTASLGPQPANDAAFAINPTNRKNVITAANDYNCATIAATYASADSGQTWTRTCVVNVLGTVGEGSPTLAYDRRGRAYRGTVNSGAAGGVAVERSLDGGSTWAPPVIAASILTPGGSVDSPALVADTDPASPFVNSLYVAAAEFDNQSNTDIAVAHSTDHGATWTTVPIGVHEQFPTVNQFPSLAIAPDGTVYVSWMRCTAGRHPLTCGGTVAQLLVSSSPDGGATWTPPMKIHFGTLPPDTCHSFYGCLPNTHEQMSDVAQLSVDHSSSVYRGTLYAGDFTYEHPGRMRVRVSSSSDGGAVWSNPKYLAPFALSHDQFLPNISVGSNGILGATWLDRRNDPANVSYQPFAATSLDGGVTFSSAVLLSTAFSNPQNDGFQGSFLGEHIGCGWSGDSFFSAWTDTSNGAIGLDVVGGLRP